MSDDTLQVPLGDPAFFAGDPHPELAELRRRCPISWQSDGEFWAVTSLRDIQTVGKDPATFCSGQGVLMSDRGRDIAAEDSLLYLDPPRHEQYRKLVNRAFTPRRVATLEPRIRQLTLELLDTIDPRSPVDLVDSLCAPLPMLVIAELLGLPDEDRESFRRWSDAIMEAATDLNEENAVQAMELIAYFDVQLDQRTDAPTEDLLSGLLMAEVDGASLTRAEVQGFCMTLMVAGNETTRSLVSGGMVELARHPDQRARLVADPELIPVAVEEMLRWVTPIMAMARTTTRSVSLGDAELGAGEFVVLAYGAANRDEEVFGNDAGVFDISRNPNPHVSFGFGEHFCIGASLARLEARILLEEVLARWPDYQLAGEVVRAPSTLFRQITRAPVLFAR
ncbi:MAG TPA: cytochrome P450 [Acidimicrobiales bacterium]|jgi:cytochrome P450|nr:cytochrome P450 [Acidimicrobiales bacterium]